MTLYEIKLNCNDYYNTYTDIIYWLAECRASSRRLISFVPDEDCSKNKFNTYLKRALSEFKRQRILEFYTKFADIALDKTTTKYLLNKYPELSGEIDTEALGFIVQL